MSPTTTITDLQRAKFMELLLAAARDEYGLLLTPWEQDFVASYTHTQQYWRWFTPGRRAATDNLWRKYGAELKHPFPTDLVNERPKMADADPEGCQYVVKDEGRQRRCNDPAEFQEPGRLRYCRAHGEAVEKDCKRANISIRLIKFP